MTAASIGRALLGALVGHLCVSDGYGIMGFIICMIILIFGLELTRMERTA